MKILSFSNGSNSKWWRLESPARWINRLTKHQMVVKDRWNWFNCIRDEKYDIVHGQTFISPRLVPLCQAKGMKVIYELDDAILNYDEKRKTLARVFKHVSKRALFETIKKCDAVTVTSKEIKKQIRRFYSGAIYVLPNYIDLDWWGKPPKKTLKKEIKIGWFGSTSHREDLETIALPVMRHILSKYQNVIFYTHSFSREIFKQIGSNRIRYIKPCHINQWKQILRSTNWDIGISPLLNDTFNNCKSPIKYFEFAAIKTPGVYSPPVYGKVIRHKETGFIADNNIESWVKYLEMLIRDPSVRIEMGNEAYQDVVKKYDMKDHYYEWIDVFKQTLHHS